MQEGEPILFTIPNFITAGSGRAMLNIIERLDRKRFRPAVAVMRKGGNLDKEVERLRIPFLEAPFTVPAKPYHSLLFRAWKAATKFRPYGFHLWHSFHYAGEYTEPIIARLAGARSWIYTKKNMNWYNRSWYLRTLLASGVAVQNTDMMHKFFGNGMFARKARLIPRGVDTRVFCPQTREYFRFRDDLGIPADAIVIGCVAHLLPVKGHPTLLEAISRIPSVYLLVAGKPVDSAYAASLGKMAHSLGINSRTFFLEEVKDVAGLLSEVDIFVLPTWAKWRMEGCPVALLEAMASGKACIATNIPGARDVIENGESGYLVPPANSRALADSISKMVASFDIRSALGKAARQRVLNLYSIEKEVAAHEALYTQILYKSNGANKL